MKQTSPWVLLVVDDEPEVRRITRIVLARFEFEERGLEILDAGSAREARAVLAVRKDVALLIADVVMETERAGLDRVRHVREQLNNKDDYLCPAGKVLRRDRRNFTIPRSRVTKANTILYRASAHDCTGCPMKPQCCPNTPIRKVMRSIHEQASEVARKIATTAQNLASRCERKKVEMLFAHLKRILRLDRLRLRGMSGARDEFLMAASAQNLRRMAKRSLPMMQKGPQGIPA